MKTDTFLKSGAVLAVIAGLSAFVGYLTRLVLSRSLDIANFGLFYGVLSFVLAFSLVVDLGMGQAIQVMIAPLIKQKKARQIKGYILGLLAYHVALRVIVTLGIAIASGMLAAGYFKSPSAGPVIIIFALAFLFSGLGSFTNVFAGYQKFGTAAFLTFARVLLNLLFLTGALALSNSVVVAAGAYAASMIFTDILTFAVFWRRIMPDFFRIKAEGVMRAWKKLISFGFLLTVSTIFIQVMGFLDSIVITGYVGLQVLGLYQMALPTAAILIYLIQWPMGMMIPATVAGMGKRAGRRIVNEVRDILMVLLVFAIAYFQIFSGAILQLLFAQSNPLAALMLSILIVNKSVLVLVQFSMSVLTGLKKAKTLVVQGLIGTAVLVSLGIGLTILWGAIGTIIAYLASFVLMLVLLSVAISKACGARPSPLFFLKLAACGGLAYGGMRLLALIPSPMIITMIICGIGGLALYALLVLLTRTIDPAFALSLVRRNHKA